MSRIVYLIFYILFLLFISEAIGLISYEQQIPTPVRIPFQLAFFILIVTALMKEFLLNRKVTANGREVNDEYFTFWIVLYAILELMAIVLFIIGCVYITKYSPIHWWIWMILIGSVILYVISNSITAFAPNGGLASLILSIISLILLILATVLLIVNNNLYWGVWVALILANIFAILSTIFETLADKNITVISEPLYQSITPIVYSSNIPVIYPSNN